MNQYTINEKYKKIMLKQKSFEYKKNIAKNLRIGRYEAKVKKFKDMLESKFLKYKIRSKKNLELSRVY